MNDLEICQFCGLEDTADNMFHHDGYICSSCDASVKADFNECEHLWKRDIYDDELWHCTRCNLHCKRSGNELRIWGAVGSTHFESEDIANVQIDI